MKALTWAELKEEIRKLFLDCASEEDWVILSKTPVMARFDFPLEGRKEYYKVIGVNNEGIILRNERATRPTGHE